MPKPQFKITQTRSTQWNFTVNNCKIPLSTIGLQLQAQKLIMITYHN